jgi:hypothetical protein
LKACILVVAQLFFPNPFVWRVEKVKIE